MEGRSSVHDAQGDFVARFSREVKQKGQQLDQFIANRKRQQSIENGTAYLQAGKGVERAKSAPLSPNMRVKRRSGGSADHTDEEVV